MDPINSFIADRRKRLRGKSPLSNPLLDYQAMLDSSPVGSVDAPGGVLPNPYSKETLSKPDDTQLALDTLSMIPGPQSVVTDPASWVNFLVKNPEERTLGNFGLAGLSVLPFFGGATAWHGSHALYDKVDLSKALSGEGANAYGKGFYSADKQNMGEWYRDSIVAGKKLPKGSGYLYEVDVADESIPKMIDWYAPMSEQPATVQQLAREMFGKNMPASGKDFYRAVATEMRNRKWNEDRGINKAGKFSDFDRASEYLRKRGVSGVKYQDKSLRNKPGESATNYVNFNEEDVEIIKRNGEYVGKAKERAFELGVRDDLAAKSPWRNLAADGSGIHDIPTKDFRAFGGLDESGQLYKSIDLYYDGSVPVAVNPKSLSELKEIMDETEATGLRLIKDAKGNSYYWPDNTTLHADMANVLGITDLKQVREVVPWEDLVSGAFKSGLVKDTSKGYDVVEMSPAEALKYLEENPNVNTSEWNRAYKAFLEGDESVGIRAFGSQTKGFTTNTTDMPFYDEMLRKPEYFKEAKGLEFKIVDMDPQDYLDRVAKEFKKTNPEAGSFDTYANQDLINEYAQKMSAGEKFPMLTFDTRNGFSQEGRHRAKAAIKAGIRKVPVMMVNKIRKATP